jgi:hypothetical protein
MTSEILSKMLWIFNKNSLTTNVLMEIHETNKIQRRDKESLFLGVSSLLASITLLKCAGEFNNK